MAYASENLCTREEYDRNFPDRLMERELSVGGLFTVYMRLQDNAFPHALRYPTRIIALDGLRLDPPRIVFSLLSRDLREYRDRPVTTSVMNSGVLDLRTLGSFGEYDGNVISEGYFMGYEQVWGLDDQLKALLDQPLTAPVVK